MTHPTLAFVRSVSDSFDQALAAERPLVPIDVVLAKRQHASYVEALRSLGLLIRILEADMRHPDCCFVEDTAVVAEGVALVTHPGAESRRGEVEPVAQALAELVRVERVTPPATLDGGDCLRVGQRIYVGESGRTNAAGIARLEDLFGPLGYEVIAVPLQGVLHLKCLASPLSDGSVLIAEDAPFLNAFREVPIVAVPSEESAASNCISIGRTAIIAAGFPKTRSLLEARGITVIPLDLSEFRKADGAITCLSILV